jgi:hypothetical protein
LASHAAALSDTAAMLFGAGAYGRDVAHHQPRDRLLDTAAFEPRLARRQVVTVSDARLSAFVI